MDKRKLLYTCERDSQFMERLVTNLLVPIADSGNGIGSDFTKRVRRDYPRLLQELAVGWLPIFAQQFTAFKLFGRDRLFRQYLQEPRLQKRSRREKSFLESTLFKPWQFGFLQLVEDLGDDFFTMRNVLTEEILTLYSPGVGKYEADGQKSFYLVLLNFNGECYQTYGPLIAFVGLQPLDLLFFAQRLDGGIKTHGDAQERLQADPLPFMMLVMAANLPLTYFKDQLLMINRTDLQIDDLDLTGWEAYFKIRKEEGVYQLHLKRWYKSPHFVQCYYAPQDRMFIARATTRRGWEKLVDTLQGLGLPLESSPQIETTMAGMAAVRQILGEDVGMTPYDELFKAEISQAEQEGLEAINRFLGLLIPHINDGSAYDLEELAAQAGVDPRDARGIAAQIEKKFGKW